jgi:transposase-like protein
LGALISMERPVCPKCLAESPNKNGFHLKSQRWKCTTCGYEFTQTTPRGKPYWLKLLAHCLIKNGVEAKIIADLSSVSSAAVSKWTGKPRPELDKLMINNAKIISVNDIASDILLRNAGNVDEAGTLLLKIKSNSLVGQMIVELELP